MENYLNRESAIVALQRMRDFENSIEKCFQDAGLSLRSNLGRRNGVISGAQESFFAEEINRFGVAAKVDGRTGEPDISLTDMGRELECKLTSGCGGTWSLQTDYSTLKRKESLDYLYVLASPCFDKFAVLHFSDLSVDDFHPPAPGSREKARMRKDVAMERCNPLVGQVINRNHKMIESIESQVEIVSLERDARILELKKREAGTRTQHQKNKISGILERETARYDKKLLNLFDRINYWKEASAQFSIELEEID